MSLDIDRLYEKYGAMVFRRCKYLLKDEDKAYDAVQDVFIRVFEKQNSLTMEYPSSLLYRIATNICLNILRSTKRKADVDDGDLIDYIASYDDHENKFILREMIDNIFKKELPGTREIAFMYYIDKMTYLEISNEVGMSVSGIRKRLRKLKENARLEHSELLEEDI